MEVHPATLWEAISDTVPTRLALVQGGTRRTWHEFEDRSSRLAGALAAHGIGPGARIGQLLFNCPEFLKSYFAALKLRAIPFNVNYRYTADEIAFLLANADADALFYHASLADVVARAVTTSRLTLIEVDDGASSIAASLRYEDVISSSARAPRISRSPDDVTMIYTGGTTGMPKGVVTKVGPALAYLLESVPPMVGFPPLTVDEAPAAAAALGPDEVTISLPAPPLMHNTGLGIGVAPAFATGGTVVLLDGRRFDAGELWDTVAAERVNSITIVGDAFARPMLAELDAEAARDLTCVRAISSSGAMFSAEVKAGLLRHLPQAFIVDVIAASEGTMGLSIATANTPVVTGKFHPVPGVILISEDGRLIEPGSDEPGLVALPGGAEGYYKDETKSAATFRVLDGRRYTIPGDYATIGVDGTLTLLGRGSTCINTAGEKVYPEEVEEALKAHPAVLDALVFGVDDERFGQRVAAVMSFIGEPASIEDVLATARDRLASYKIPRAVVVVDEVPRTQVGKADYATARQRFTDAGS